jgi:deazaflavin-dependent oxidoreductase (nitroreductase family)
VTRSELMTVRQHRRQPVVSVPPSRDGGQPDLNGMRGAATCFASIDPTQSRSAQVEPWGRGPRYPPGRAATHSVSAIRPEFCGPVFASWLWQHFHSLRAYGPQFARVWSARMALFYVDPGKKDGFLYRVFVRFARSRPGQFSAHHINPGIYPWLHRVTGGRYPLVLGRIATAPLVTTGAKSGQPREVQLNCFRDGNDPILIASNYGGPKHPQWYHNLKAHPDCQFGDQKFVATVVTDPDEYARLYGLAEYFYTGYGDDRVKAAAIGRRIPVFRLKPF